MRYSPIERTDRLYVGKEWTLKELRAISAILHVTHGVVAAGNNLFYKAFGKNLEQFHEILAMPRDMIMYRAHYEETGYTEQWLNLYRQLSEVDKRELLDLTSFTVSELKRIDCPIKLKKILPYYFLKYKKK